ncbi:hypothetical protein EYC84_003574 [Monilinia fructicola]|uniref:Uncharacterized protein n=1 Tax=Monilinia fructicola TaxID=38448 RepID=A0A5M9JX33_MONFR|nr:hypothetical protein EYC84_003574 [Monilinia fructicola]
MTRAIIYCWKQTPTQIINHRLLPHAWVAYTSVVQSSIPSIPPSTPLPHHTIGKGPPSSVRNSGDRQPEHHYLLLHYYPPSITSDFVQGLAKGSNPRLLIYPSIHLSLYLYRSIYLYASHFFQD